MAPRRDHIFYLATVLTINLPFLLCHPDHPVIAVPILRSLAINAVLFLVPAVPFVGVMIRRGWLRDYSSLWLFLLSSMIFVGSLVSVHVLRLPIRAGVIWNIEWLVCNLGVVLNLVFHGASDLYVRVSGKKILHTLTPFLLVYIVLFYGATCVVPILPDQDDEVQGTAYGLIMHLKPSFRTARHTEYFFSHPPAVHVYVAGSLLYFNLLEQLAIYDSLTPNSLSPEDMFEHYNKYPHLLETRSPGVFFGALTALLLYGWVMRLSGRWWIGLLVAFTYVSTPAVFVRSAYAGYFAVTNLLQIQIFLLMEDRELKPEKSNWIACFLAGTVAALCDHKMILLPISLVFWEIWRMKKTGRQFAAANAISHPLVMGFTAGMALFWVYGLTISPGDFLRDHVHNHLIDRVLHYNPLGYSGYPGLTTLWIEFWRHTGYLLLPLGIISLGVLCFRRSSNGCTGRGWSGTAGLWSIWTISLAIVFSSVDWRQTKHLAPMTMPLSLAMAHFIFKRYHLVFGSLLLLAILAINLSILYPLVRDFNSLPALPDW